MATMRKEVRAIVVEGLKKFGEGSAVTSAASAIAALYSRDRAGTAYTLVMCISMCLLFAGYASAAIVEYLFGEDDAKNDENAKPNQ